MDATGSQPNWPPAARSSRSPARSAAAVDGRATGSTSTASARRTRAARRPRRHRARDARGARGGGPADPRDGTSGWIAAIRPCGTGSHRHGLTTHPGGTARRDGARGTSERRDGRGRLPGSRLTMFVRRGNHGFRCRACRMRRGRSPPARRIKRTWSPRRAAPARSAATTAPSGAAVPSPSIPRRRLLARRRAG